MKKNARVHRPNTNLRQRAALSPENVQPTRNDLTLGGKISRVCETPVVAKPAAMFGRLKKQRVRRRDLWNPRVPNTTV